MKSSAYDMNPKAALSLFFSIIKSTILHQNVKQKVALLGLFPCQTPLMLVLFSNELEDGGVVAMR